MMTQSTTYLALLAAGMLFFGSAACSDDAESSNNDTNNTAEQDATGTPDTDEDLDSTLPEDWSFESEYSLRFTKFALDPGAPLNQLNGIINTNIEEQEEHYPIVVLLKFRNLDESTNTLDLRGGAGLKADIECLPGPEFDGVCDYKWDPDGSDKYTIGSAIDSDTGELNADLDSLDFIVSFELDGDVLKSAIPITDLTLTGSLRPTGEADGVEIPNGVLEGYITEEAAESAEIQLSSGAPAILLSELLANTDKTTDLSGDGTKDAWKLTGTFIAIEATIIEE